MVVRTVPLPCASPNSEFCKVEISEMQLAGKDGSVGSWRVACVNCQRETTVGFVLKHGGGR